jgi:ATP-binding protein involved in chromosome partitioning
MTTDTTLQASLTAALQAIPDPITGRAFARRISAKVENGRATVELKMGYFAKSIKAELTRLVRDAVKTVPDIKELSFSLHTEVQAHAATRGVKLLEQVRNIIAVASGKGGVGKSTTAANLALALAAEGARVGVLDADIYGPSQHVMLALEGRPELVDERMMAPKISHGLQVASIGLMVDADSPMVWRGPMATGALEQLLNQTAWEDLDYLIVDMPPGTGDIALTLSQKVPLTGAIIVTTPQDIALLDARRGLRMFEKVNVPILGVVENMSMHICSNCGHAEAIFGEGGGKSLCEQYGTEFLGALPLDMQIRMQADGGAPTVVASPDGTNAKLYRDLALKVAAKIAHQAKDYSSKFPTITISKNT